MVSRCIVSLVALMFASYAVVHSQIIDTKLVTPKPGSVSPLVPSLDDMKVCKDNAKGRTFKMVYKMPLHTCQPMCVYENNEKEQVQAVDGQLCCDFVGVGPTGLCKGGKCMLGGVADVSTKKGLDMMKKFGK